MDIHVTYPGRFIAVLLAFLIATALVCSQIKTLEADETPESLGHGKIVAWFYPEMNKKATLITRTIDCEAGMVNYTANSHTYGYAVAISSVPIKDTLLIYKEVCSGTQTNK